MTYATIARLMAKHHVRRIPVVDDRRRPTGMASLNDLARAMATAHQLRADEIANTLAAISEHRTTTIQHAP
jgi:CBS domain-containing protein